MHAATVSDSSGDPVSSTNAVGVGGPMKRLSSSALCSRKP
jgi:hypothetical protein